MSRYNLGMKTILLAGEKKQTVQGESGLLEVLSYETGSPAALAVICHPHPVQGGTMINKVVTTLHKAFAEKNFNTIRFNFRGVGESEGAFAEGLGETQDLLTILKWATGKYPELPIYLAGFSFGSYISYRVAGDPLYKDKIVQLLSIAPPVQYAEFHTLPVPVCPWLVIQGDTDEIVDAKAVYKWLESIDKKIEVVRFPDTGHFFHGKLNELRDAVKTHLIL
jgi:alpha/beta superfamily hydrolase